MLDIRCFRCGITPADLPEYWPTFTGTELVPEEYVKQEEGTYNPENGHFACTECYMALGMPTAPAGWRAP